ncbi:MAG TPA: PIG-L deacetylase family protein [Dehalococcoidia bacterium]|nr:PIG-L deacetylase family protein [Dehalococcoidia bacterium]
MKRIVVFEAHGDDMEFMAAGTIAKFTDAGHEVTLVVATDNDKGSFELSADELRAARDREIHGAAHVLGITNVIALGYSDGDLAAQASPQTLRGQFMRVIRETRADIVFTWDPFAPYEGHPDHRAVAIAAHEAASFAHFPLYYPEQIADGLAPQFVSEQWFFAKSPRDINKYVDIDATIDRKVEALCQHDSQMVLTIADMKYALAASGLDVPWLAALDPHDYRDAIDRRMRAAGKAVAARSGLGCTYAEAFRRTRYGGIESLAKGQTIPEDV